MLGRPNLDAQTAAQTEAMKVDLISSAAKRVPLESPLKWSPRETVEYGDLVVGRVKRVSPNYPNLEVPGGGQVLLKESKTLVGVLGERRALNGFSGKAPSRLRLGMRLHLLNMGGVIGQCTGFHRNLEWPTEIEYLGTVRGNSGALNIKNFALPIVNKLLPQIPVVMVVGTCMDSGKTLVCKQLLKYFSKKGFSISAGKVTGVAAQRDVISMEKSGAKKVLSFFDFGLVSTTGQGSLVPVAHSMVHYLSSSKPDFILLEMGDGIVGAYRGSDLLEDAELMDRCVSIILCANDLMGVWGGLQWITQPDGENQSKVLISGRVTDSTEGVRFIEQNWNLAAANAFDGAAKMCTHVLEAMMPWLKSE